MATVGQIYYNVVDKRNRTCVSSGTDIFRDIVSGYQATQFTKIGIQAKPGTKVIMGTDNTGSNDKTIIIGITGIYELDNDIAIKKMLFLRPLKYEFDPDESTEAMREGVAIIRAAEIKREQDLAAAMRNYGTGGVAPNNPAEPTFQAYWNAFNRAQTEFLQQYNLGLSKYQNGINGIYKLPNENNLEAPENYDDLYDVIVDFLYE